MRLLWIDATHGAAGDMLLAALLDAGADEASVQAGVTGLAGVAGPAGAVEPIGIRSEQVRRHGLRARLVTVDTAPSDRRRTLPDVTALLANADLPAPVRRFARDVFERIAGAEAAVHGVDVEEVHFHEVGALDSIADVVGCGLALHSLGVLTESPDARPRVVVTPVAVGSGRVGTAHGVLPVPVPAVLELLRGVPVAAHTGDGELCTPTGAALLRTLADAWGPLPACVPVRTGVGAGGRDPVTHPNIVRVVVADTVPTGSPGPLDVRDLVLIESTVDDLDPRLWPDVLDTMRTLGAADAWCTPVLARKGRPGHVLSVLVPDALVEAICRAIFDHTATLGLRLHRVERRALNRDQVTVTYAGHAVSVKRGIADGRVVSAQPEYEDVRQAAAAAGVPIRTVLHEVTLAATEHPPPSG